MIRALGGSHGTIGTDVRNNTNGYDLVVLPFHTQKARTMDPQNPKDRLVTKDELNLVEFPFTLAAHRAPKSVQRIVVSEVKLDPGGRPLTREWTVHPSGYGLPLAMDEEVFLGLMHFLYLADFREREPRVL
jgi:hypothetical protein